MVFKKIKDIIESLDVAIISNDRKSILQPLIEYIQAKISSQQELRLNFISRIIQGEVIFLRYGHKQ